MLSPERFIDLKMKGTFLLSMTDHRPVQVQDCKSVDSGTGLGLIVSSVTHSIAIKHSACYYFIANLTLNAYAFFTMNKLIKEI